jgi:hypothetical protein
MKIKEFAVEKGVTPGAIYKAVQRSGHSAKELTDKRGNITAKGAGILQKLFPDDTEPRSEPLKEERADNSTLDDLRDRLRAAEERAEKWERLYLELQEKTERERASLLDRISEANRLISQQQELARLASMNPIKRLFSGRKKEQQQQIPSDGQIN